MELDKETQLRALSAKLLNDINALVLLCDRNETSMADYHNPPATEPAKQLEDYIVSFKERISFLEREVEQLYERTGAWREQGAPAG